MAGGTGGGGIKGTPSMGVRRAHVPDSELRVCERILPGKHYFAHVSDSAKRASVTVREIA